MTGPAELSVDRHVVDELIRLAALEVPGVVRVDPPGPRWRAASSATVGACRGSTDAGSTLACRSSHGPATSSCR